jgi:hypothetical protein
MDRDVSRLLVSLSGLLIFLFINGLSYRWVRRRERQLLTKALGRSLRPGEEDSLATWLQVPKDQLASAVEQLNENPFKAAVEAVDRGRPYDALKPEEPSKRSATTLK